MQVTRGQSGGPLQGRDLFRALDCLPTALWLSLAECGETYCGRVCMYVCAGLLAFQTCKGFEESSPVHADSHVNSQRDSICSTDGRQPWELQTVLRRYKLFVVGGKASKPMCIVGEHAAALTCGRVGPRHNGGAYRKIPQRVPVSGQLIIICGVAHW